MRSSMAVEAARMPLPGVWVAIVRDVADPEGRGRVRVELAAAPDASGGGYAAWGRLLAPMAGDERGTWFPPEVGDEVLVAFEQGDPQRPAILGGVWNGVDRPPAAPDAGHPTRKIRTRSGLEIRLEDLAGGGRVAIETPGGQRLVLDDEEHGVRLEDSNGNSVVLSSSGVRIAASAKVTIQAGIVEVSAGMVQVDSGMAKFSGVVQSDTVITNSVVASSYTPGAGNIW